MKFLSFLARRVLVTAPAGLAVIVITFAMIRLVPGDPVQVMAGTDLDPAVAQQLRAQLGLDKPVIVQFWDYLKEVADGRKLRLSALVNEVAEATPGRASLASALRVFALAHARRAARAPVHERTEGAPAGGDGHAMRRPWRARVLEGLRRKGS